jgi:N-acetylmuramoyl-L-alanine amidase
MRFAGFTVLRAPDVPSVLLELGFLSNAEDVKLLTSDAWREKVTDAMASAVRGFFDGRMAGTP